MTTKTDPFSVNENPLGNVGGKWTTFLGSGLKCVSPDALGNSGGAYDGSMWNSADYTFANDQDATVTVTAVSNADYFGPCVRCATTGGGRGYFARYSNGAAAIDVYAVSAGAIGASILNISNSLIAGDTLTLAISGTGLTIKKNGATIGSVTDATYASGQPGAMYGFFNSDASLIADFTANDAAGGGPTITVVPSAGAQRNRRSSGRYL